MSETRPIPFAPGYFVSSNGMVYSSKYGPIRRLRPWMTRGYETVSVCAEGSVQKMLVHRLVALVFLGSPTSSGLEVRHLDGNPKNNDVSNLAWGTHAENMADMVRHGRQGPKNKPERMRRGDAHPMRSNPSLARRGERAPQAKLTEQQVRDVRRRCASGERPVTLAREMNVTQQLIYRINNRLCWKHVE